VSVVCGRVALGEELRQEGVEVIYILLPGSWRCGRTGAVPGRSTGCCARGGSTLRTTHNPKGGLLGPMVSRLARVPVVVHTVHGVSVQREYPRFQPAAGAGR